MNTLPLFDVIRPGARVTIITPHGSELTGRCVMKFAAHAVLNLGGRHGTPGIATAENTTRVRFSKTTRPALIG